MKTTGLKLIIVLLLLGLLHITASALPTDGVSLTVNGKTVQRAGNSFSMLSACSQNQAVIEVTAGPLATIQINGVAQNPATVNLAVYGNNTVNIMVTPQGGNPQNYTLIVNKPIPFHSIVEQRWNDVLVVNNNPANNGGYSFTSFKFFRNGLLVGTGQNWTNDGPLNPSDVFYVEMTANNVSGVIRSCLSIEL